MNKWEKAGVVEDYFLSCGGGLEIWGSWDQGEALVVLQSMETRVKI